MALPISLCQFIYLHKQRPVTLEKYEDGYELRHYRCRWCGSTSGLVVEGPNSMTDWRRFKGAHYGQG